MIKFIQKNTKYLTIAGAFSLLVICYFQQKENTKLRTKVAYQNSVDSLLGRIKVLEEQRDSISWELFPIEVELGRYQTAFKLFSKRNPKAAEQYAEIISSETE